MVYCTGLENRQGLKSFVGSNPTLSAIAAVWLAVAMLRAQASNAAEPTRLLRHPCLFPYRLPHWAASELVASSRRLEALRQGLDEEALILRSP